MSVPRSRPPAPGALRLPDATYALSEPGNPPRSAGASTINQRGLSTYNVPCLTEPVPADPPCNSSVQFLMKSVILRSGSRRTAAGRCPSACTRCTTTHSRAAAAEGREEAAARVGVAPRRGTAHDVHEPTHLCHRGDPTKEWAARGRESRKLHVRVACGRAGSIPRGLSGSRVRGAPREARRRRRGGGADGTALAELVLRRAGVSAAPRRAVAARLDGVARRAAHAIGHAARVGVAPAEARQRRKWRREWRRERLGRGRRQRRRRRGGAAFGLRIAALVCAARSRTDCRRVGGAAARAGAIGVLVTEGVEEVVRLVGARDGARTRRALAVHAALLRSVRDHVLGARRMERAVGRHPARADRRARRALSGARAGPEARAVARRVGRARRDGRAVRRGKSAPNTAAARAARAVGRRVGGARRDGGARCVGRAADALRDQKAVGRRELRAERVSRARRRRAGGGHRVGVCIDGVALSRARGRRGGQGGGAIGRARAALVGASRRRVRAAIRARCALGGARRRRRRALRRAGGRRALRDALAVRRGVGRARRDGHALRARGQRAIALGGARGRRSRALIGAAGLAAGRARARRVARAPARRRGRILALSGATARARGDGGMGDAQITRGVPRWGVQLVCAR
eukprot:5552422-Prymnesium_polylepis.1